MRRHPSVVLPAVAALLVWPAAPRSVPPALEAEMFGVDFAHSSVEFSIRFMGLTNVHGRFTDFAGTIMYLERDVTRSTITVIIKAKSIDTGVPTRDNDLRGHSFFATDSFPTITFQSTRIEKTESGFVARGLFTLHGVTKELTIPFVQLHGKLKDGWGNTRVGFAGALKLNRHDFHIDGTNFWNQVIDLSRMALADTVNIDLAVEGIVWNFDRFEFGSRPGTRPIGAALQQTITEKGVGAARAQYALLTRDSAAAYTTGEGQLNTLGYKLLQAGRVDDAIAIFQLNVETFPQSSNVYDSLGEAYLAKGDRVNARVNYQRSLDLDPLNTGAIEVLRWLKGGGGGAGG